MTAMFRQFGWEQKALYTESGLVCSFNSVALTKRLHSDDNNIYGYGGQSQ